MKKLILVLLLVFVFSGCSNNEQNEEMLNKAKAMVACKDKGGMVSYITPPTVFILKATCKNGEVLDYANLVGPDVIEAYNKLESEKQK